MSPAEVESRPSDVPVSSSSRAELGVERLPRPLELRLTSGRGSGAERPPGDAGRCRRLLLRPRLIREVGDEVSEPGSEVLAPALEPLLYVLARVADLAEPALLLDLYVAEPAPPRLGEVSLRNAEILLRVLPLEARVLKQILKPAADPAPLRLKLKPLKGEEVGRHQPIRLTVSVVLSAWQLATPLALNFRTESLITSPSSTSTSHV